MIGSLAISDRLKAVLHDDGRWECAHKGYEGELNTTFKPRSTGVAAVLPFGVAALTEAASAYKCAYQLAHKLPPSPEVRKAQKETKSLSPFAARVKSLKELIHYKAMEERRNKRGHRYCIETTTGRRVPCPPKVGASPLKGDSTQKPVTPSTPERIVSGDTPTSGKVRKRGEGTVKAPSASEAKQPKGQAAPEQKARPTNPKFADTNLIVSMMESAREGDPAGLAALADWQEEKYGDDVDAKPFPEAGSQVSLTDPRRLKHVAELMLEHRIRELVDHAGNLASSFAGRNTNERMESALAAGSLTLRWDDPKQYELGQTLLARGWNPNIISWQGEGAPIRGPIPPDPNRESNLLEGFAPAHVPEGDVPMAYRRVPNGTGSGGATRFDFSRRHTDVAPNPQALKKYQEPIKRAIRAVQAKARPDINPRAHVVRTADLVREIRADHPKAAMTEIWGAVREMTKQGYVFFQAATAPGPDDPPTNPVARDESADNGLMWRGGYSVVLNIHPEWAHDIRRFMNS